jgi:hypothetical protein
MEVNVDRKRADLIDDLVRVLSKQHPDYRFALARSDDEGHGPTYKLWIVKGEERAWFDVRLKDDDDVLLLPGTREAMTVLSAIQPEPLVTAGKQKSPRHVEDMKGRLPRLWRLFSYVLPRKTRRDVFEPLYNEMLADYLEARRYRGKWARRWLKVCFTLKTVAMVAGCFRAMVSDKLLSAVLALVPKGLRELWGDDPQRSQLRYKTPVDRPAFFMRATDLEAGDGSADAIDVKPGGLLAVPGAKRPAARVVRPRCR